VAFSVRRLGLGDAALLELLAREDADFDLEGRGVPIAPLGPEAARAFLADPGILTCVAEDGGHIVGFLYGHRLLKRAGEVGEALLYEIGVRQTHRRRGIGRALVEALFAWMDEHHLREVWVLADNPAAAEFYGACGFEMEPGSSFHIHRRSPAP
jgi:ribosomal protein S18 acetylase RimI-like enzyme